MDYYYYSMWSYKWLHSQFDDISNILLGKLKQFEQQNFYPNNGYLMGQSFGSQLVIDAGRKFDGKLGGIDGIYNINCVSLL